MNSASLIHPSSCRTPQGEAMGHADVPGRASPQVRAGGWAACGRELPELAAPLLFQLSSSVREFPATEVAVWARSSFCHSGWLEFQKKKTAHTTVYPGLPSVPLAGWCHRVAPCSTCVSNAFGFSAQIVKVVLSDTSLLLPATNQNPRVLGISACCTLVNNFF